MVKISASTLSVDFDNLDKEIRTIEDAVEFIHIDVMDGEFVSNETRGIEMLEKAHDATALPLDTHLMVEKPEDWLEEFATSSIITFHVEAVNAETAENIIEYLHEHDIKAGMAIKPNTAVEEIIPYLDRIDMVLVMLVEPGYGGQQMIEGCLEKVRAIREMKPYIDIEVDGGIDVENVYKTKTAGANIIVAGTAIFSAEDRKYVIEKLKE